jgi:hypothetical protein
MQKRLGMDSFTVDLVGTPGLRLKTIQRNIKGLKIEFKKDEQVLIRDDVLRGLKDERGYSLMGKTLGDSIWDDYLDASSNIEGRLNSNSSPDGRNKARSSTGLNQGGFLGNVLSTG